MKTISTSPLFHDIKRTLTSKSVLILMSVLILSSLAVIPSFASTGSVTGSNFANTQVFTYYDSNGSYHFLAFAWNQFGQPVSGVTFQANLTLNSTPLFFGATTTSSPTPVYRTPAATTNSSGVAQFEINAPLNSNYTVLVSTTQPNSLSKGCCSFSQPYHYYAESILPGETVGLSGNYITLVVDSANASREDIQINWAGNYAAPPANYAVYFKFIDTTSICGPEGLQCSITYVNPNSSGLNESNMQLLGTMVSYRQIFSPPKLEANLSKGAQIVVGFFYPNGTSTSQLSYFPVNQIYPPPPPPISPSQSNSFVISFFESIFGMVIPLIAILGSYNSYGKDRISGVLESVLSQPVSRGGLSLSRFVSCFVATAVGVSISVMVVDTIAWFFTGSFVSSAIVLSSIAAFFVELATFVGIMMLLSHVVRSSAVLIGTGIGLFIVIDFFWGIILQLLANITAIQYFSTGYLQLAIVGEFGNPAQFVSLVDTYLTHQASFVGISPFNVLITPSQYGVTISSIVTVGILWIALPLAGFLYLAMKRD